MNVDSGAPHFAYLHGRTVLRILFPRISKKATHLLHTVILTDTHRAAPHPHHSVSGMRTDTAYGRARPPHPRRFAVLVHAFVWRCAGRWPSLCTMHAPLPCNCRCLISGSSRRLPSPGMRRPALNTCTRKYGRRGRTPFLHGACVRIWSLHASVHNGSMAACRFAIGWHGACPVGCTGVTGRVMETRFAALARQDGHRVCLPPAAKCD